MCHPHTPHVPPPPKKDQRSGENTVHTGRRQSARRAKPPEPTSSVTMTGITNQPKTTKDNRSKRHTKIKRRPETPAVAVLHLGRPAGVRGLAPTAVISGNVDPSTWPKSSTSWLPGRPSAMPLCGDAASSSSALLFRLPQPLAGPAQCLLRGTVPRPSKEGTPDSMASPCSPP